MELQKYMLLEMENYAKEILNHIQDTISEFDRFGFISDENLLQILSSTDCLNRNVNRRLEECFNNDKEE